MKLKSLCVKEIPQIIRGIGFAETVKWMIEMGLDVFPLGGGYDLEIRGEADNNATIALVVNRWSGGEIIAKVYDEEDVDRLTEQRRALQKKAFAECATTGRPIALPWGAVVIFSEGRPTNIAEGMMATFGVNPDDVVRWTM